MTPRPAGTTPLGYARVAGFLYLSLLPLGLFGILYVSSRLIVPGDAAATASKILASESLFRFSIATALLVQLINVLVALALYKLLKPVNRTLALLMVIFLLLGVPIAMFNELNKLGALMLFHGAGSLNLFTADQVRALAMLLLDLHEMGLHIAGVFWGLWLFPMGYLVFRSGFLPRVLGVLLVIGGVGYLIETIGVLLLPHYEMNIGVLTFWGGVPFPLWLAIRGVNVEQWEKRALAGGGNS